jgi:hypothetical protein
MKNHLIKDEAEKNYARFEIGTDTQYLTFAGVDGHQNRLEPIWH